MRATLVAVAGLLALAALPVLGVEPAPRASADVDARVGVNACTIQVFQPVPSLPPNVAWPFPSEDITGCAYAIPPCVAEAVVFQALYVTGVCAG